MGWAWVCSVVALPCVMATRIRTENKYLGGSTRLKTVKPNKWNGEDNSVCVVGCSSHGVCENFECSCQLGWSPPDCSLRTCAGITCVNGECYNGHCYCDLLWKGDQCDIPLCPNGCSKHGICKFGSCQCQYDFTGVDCSIPVCPAGCSGHGRCIAPIAPLRFGEEMSNKNSFPPHCLCESGWTGEACGVRSCPKACSGHGVCRPVNATHLGCECVGGYSGVDCADMRCPNDCYSELGHGRCDRKGRCHCAFGLTMPDCAEKQQCGMLCFAHGHCDNNDCICNPGWFGINCLSKDEHDTKGAKLRSHREDCYIDPDNETLNSPSQPCSGHGLCSKDAGCLCDPLMYGKQCQHAVCPGVEHCDQECCGHGVCHSQDGRCQCSGGWEGSDCYFRTCPGGCSGNGVCNAEGQCECHGLWTGDKCHQRQCLHDCSQHGRCVKGSCVCAHKHRGLDCSLAACPVHPSTQKICSGIGYCTVDGTCICPDGDHVRFGLACEQIDYSVVPLGIKGAETSVIKIDSTSPNTVSTLGRVAVPCSRSCMSVCMQRASAHHKGKSFWSKCYVDCNTACIANCWTRGDSCE